jgi:hypothetical protein
VENAGVIAKNAAFTAVKIAVTDGYLIVDKEHIKKQQTEVKAPGEPDKLPDLSGVLIRHSGEALKQTMIYLADTLKVALS